MLTPLWLSKRSRIARDMIMMNTAGMTKRTVTAWTSRVSRRNSFFRVYRSLIIPAIAVTPRRAAGRSSA